MTTRNFRTARLRLALAALAGILPGDHIHYVAPSNRQSQSTVDRVNAIDAANAKRNRKAAKRAAQLKGKA